MRGEDGTNGSLFSYIDLEARIPAKHPLRVIRGATNAALAALDGSDEPPAPGRNGEAAARFAEKLPRGATLGADKNYNAQAFVEGLKDKQIEPHIAVNGAVSKLGKVRKTAVPAETAASAGYAVSQRVRKRIEEIFGWGKTVAGLDQLKGRGLPKVLAVFVFALAAYNIVRPQAIWSKTGDACLAG